MNTTAMFPDETYEKLVDGLAADETAEWCESLDDVLQRAGSDSVRSLLHMLIGRAAAGGVIQLPGVETPYVNTIHRDDQSEYPGNLETEEEIEGLVRWNAMAMVAKAGSSRKRVGTGKLFFCRGLW